MIEDPTPKQIEEAGQEAIELFIRKLGPDFPSGKFVIVAESVDVESGDRSVWMANGPGQTKWDTFGLLHYAETIEVAETISERL